MNCPACGYYNPQGQQACFHCALVLPLPAGDAVCAVHPEVKATGACSRCGTFGCGACLSSRGNDWLCAGCLDRVSKLPWDERESLGLWRAWWRTSVLMISSPTQSLTTAEPDAPLGSSMLFALLSTAVGFGPTMVGYALMIVPMLIFGRAGRGVGDGNALLAAGTGVGVVLLYVVLLLGFQLGSVLFVAALEHLSLVLLGAKPKSYTVTVRAHALSMGPSLLGLLPFCSLYVFPIWSIVLRIIAHLHLHKTTAGKATAAVLIPFALLCGGVVAIYLAVFALAMNLSR